LCDTPRSLSTNGSFLWTADKNRPHDYCECHLTAHDRSKSITLFVTSYIFSDKHQYLFIRKYFGKFTFARYWTSAAARVVQSTFIDISLRAYGKDGLVFLEYTGNVQYQPTACIPENLHVNIFVLNQA